MLQLALGLNQESYVNSESLFDSATFSYVVYLAIFILLFIFLIYGLRYLLRRLGRRSQGQFVIMRITLPKEALNAEGEKEKGIVEQIASAEALFSTIGGIKPHSGLLTWFKGRADNISLEIVAQHGYIYFYVAIPQYLSRFMEQQIHAQYPNANIEEVPDYNIFQPRSAIVGSYLKFVKPFIFPIRTYKDLEIDPLNAVTNALSKLKEEDGAVIQLVIRTAKPGWRNQGKKVASQMQQGKSMKEVMSSGRGFGKVVHDWTEAAVAKPKNPQENKKDYTLSPMEQETIKGLEKKASKAGFHVNIRIVVSSISQPVAQAYLENIVNAFSQYSIYEFGNGFMASQPRSINNLTHDFIYRRFDESKRVLLNTEELASVYHFPLPSTETPNIIWLLAKRAPAPVNMPQSGIYLGRNLYRGVETVVRIKDDDRRRHLYMIGKSGVGKSYLMANMAIQDIYNGHGVCVVDPHGDLVEDILARIPKERADDVVVFNPADTERPIGLNMLEAKTPSQIDFAVQEMIQIFYKLLPDPAMAGPMFEHYMRNALLVLAADTENPGTLVELPRIFTDKEFRKKKLEKVSDILVKDFWEREYAESQKGSAAADMLSYVISKTGRFIENEMMRDIIGQPKSGFDFRDVMDNQKVLLVNLSKGKTGEVNSNLLGLIIVSKLQMAAMARADLAESERRDFYLYIDEFQNFITPSIATILSEARKYRLDLILAHQYIGQLVENGNTQIRDAVLGNAGTMVAYKIGVEDAELLAKEFAPVFNAYDLVNIEKFNAYVKLLIDNQAARAFNMQTYPLPEGNLEVAKVIKELSRYKYGRERKMVEDEIVERSHLGQMSNLTK